MVLVIEDRALGGEQMKRGEPEITDAADGTDVAAVGVAVLVGVLEPGLFGCDQLADVELRARWPARAWPASR